MTMQGKEWRESVREPNSPVGNHHCMYNVVLRNNSSKEFHPAIIFNLLFYNM